MSENACPTCGSDEQFVVRGQCASDVRDPDEWHTHTIRKMGEQVSERVAMAVFHDHETGQVRIGPADGSPLDINDALALVNAARVVPSAGDVADRALSVKGHETFAYGQSSYDGDGCRNCSWQGGRNSGKSHAEETRRAALVSMYAALFASQPTVAEVREQVAREIEAVMDQDAVRNGTHIVFDDVNRSGKRNAVLAIAARIARTETKGGE